MIKTLLVTYHKNIFIGSLGTTNTLWITIQNISNQCGYKTTSALVTIKIKEQWQEDEMSQSQSKKIK
jgi:hypothetical protein